MVYITGDIHGDIMKIITFCNRFDLTPKDKIIILGDVGLNFFQNKKDEALKFQLNQLGPDIFCIHGNHEIRPEHFNTYKTQQYCRGEVFVEEKYPNILFAKDGEIYDFEGKKTLVCGGAYSVDKWYRICRSLLRLSGPMIDEAMLEKSLNFVNGCLKDDNYEIRNFLNKMYKIIPRKMCFWWDDEQPSKQTREYVEKQLEENNWNVDIVLTHTCPQKYEPTDMFLSDIDQSIVDKTTEKWFDKIEKKLKYQHWYAGHFHVDRKLNDKFTFLFDDIIGFGE